MEDETGSETERQHWQYYNDSRAAARRAKTLGYDPDTGEVL